LAHSQIGEASRKKKYASRGRPPSRKRHKVKPLACRPRKGRLHERWRGWICGVFSSPNPPGLRHVAEMLRCDPKTVSRWLAKERVTDWTPDSDSPSPPCRFDPEETAKRQEMVRRCVDEDPLVTAAGVARQLFAQGVTDRIAKHAKSNNRQSSSELSTSLPTVRRSQRTMDRILDTALRNSIDIELSKSTFFQKIFSIWGKNNRSAQPQLMR